MAKDNAIEVTLKQITITLRSNEPLIFRTGDLEKSQRLFNERMREYCATALRSAYLLGRINVEISNRVIFPELRPSPPIDPRVIELSQKTIYSAQDLDDLCKQAYAVMGWTIDQCIAYLRNDGSRVTDLAYCVAVTKHWNATNFDQLRSQGILPDDPL